MLYLYVRPDLHDRHQRRCRFQSGSRASTAAMGYRTVALGHRMGHYLRAPIAQTSWPNNSTLSRFGLSLYARAYAGQLGPDIYN
jgi:hypothetical protein